MEERNNSDIKAIDVVQIFKKLWADRTLFYKILPIAFVLACIIILGFPRYYTTEIKLVPEGGNMMISETLSSIASSLGRSKLMSEEDAISPKLYPNLMEDNAFVTNMFGIIVKDKKGEINTTYHDYLKYHQKFTIWTYPIRLVKGLIAKKEESGNNSGQFDPYYLSKTEDDIAKLIRNDIKIDIDKKSGVITLHTRAQDALICKTLGDSVVVRLQKFITDYRTNKARKDYDYYMKITTEAKKDYEEIRQRYAVFADASTNISRRSVELKMEDMENEMQLKFNTYTLMNTQLQAAKAKVQERTPAFTLLKGAAVPLRPSSPKRVIFVLGCLFMTFICTSFYILFRH